MKHFFLFAIALFFIVSCTQVADTGKKELDEVSKQNVELVKKVLQAYEDENIDAIKEAYASNCLSIGPRHDQADSTLSWIESNLEWFESSDSIKVEIITLLPYTVEEGDLAGDWVLAWANFYWYEIEAGKKLVAMWHSPIRIEEGKIVYEVSYVNQWDIYKQLGAELEWEDDNEDDDDEED